MSLQTLIRNQCKSALDLSSALTALSSKAAELGLSDMAEELAAMADSAEAVGCFDANEQGVSEEELADAQIWADKEAA